MKTNIVNFGLLTLCVACTGIAVDDKTDGTDTGTYGPLCDTTDYYYDTAGCDTGSL